MGPVRDTLIGLSVQIVIEEEGTPNPPILPPGTIIRRLTGTDRSDYYLVHLDRPVRCPRHMKGGEWTLLDLVIATRYEGGSLGFLLTKREPQPFQDDIVVGIANMLVPQAEDDPILDFSRCQYFAIGIVRRA